MNLYPLSFSDVAILLSSAQNVKIVVKMWNVALINILLDSIVLLILYI